MHKEWLRLIMALARSRGEREAHDERVKRNNDDLSEGFEQGIKSCLQILDDIVAEFCAD